MDKLADFYDLIQPGKIVEFGCGRGGLLEALQESFPDSFIVGLDVYLEQIYAAKAKGLPNVKLLVALAQNQVFLKNSFDTALFASVMHEIISINGKNTCLKSIEAAHSVLKSGGILIIKDHLRPKPHQVTFEFEDQTLKQRLLRFAEKFVGRRILLEQILENKCRLDISDAMEFLTKYEDLDDEWEMKEIHFPWREKDFEEALLQQGFNLIRRETYGARPISLPEGLRCDSEILRKDIIIAGRKGDG
jgi:SAM-dependent methyltransferase